MDVRSIVKWDAMVQTTYATLELNPANAYSVSLGYIVTYVIHLLIKTNAGVSVIKYVLLEHCVILALENAHARMDL